MILLIWNLIVFSIYGIDKYKSIHKMHRISEATLISCSYLLGSAGAIFGMIIFNHKTKKMKFRLLVPLSFFVNLAVMYYLRYYI